MEYLRQLSLSRSGGASVYSPAGRSIHPASPVDTPISHNLHTSVRTGEQQRVDGDLPAEASRVELGEFQLPILVLSTDCTSRMLMETDATSNEVYIKINKPYSLKSSDAVLTELGYDDINKLDAKIGNQLIRTFIGA